MLSTSVTVLRELQRVLERCGKVDQTRDGVPPGRVLPFVL